MTTLADYQDKYPGIRFERRDGVLQMTLHHEGGPFVLAYGVLRDLGRAFVDVAEDFDNKVVILTGTGDQFATRVDYASFTPHVQRDVIEYMTESRSHDVRLLQAFLDIEVPVISAINGPVVVHAETPLLADVVLATEDTVFQDAVHFVGGIPPGDGSHTVWTTLLGLNRGRHFLMTGQVLTAQEALDLGVVGEVHKREDLLPRAWELATAWAKYSSSSLRGTRAVLTWEWRRLLSAQLHTGLTYESAAVVAAAYEGAAPPNLPAEMPDHPVDLDPTR